jgi:hypothetical protein
MENHTGVKPDMAAWFRDPRNYKGPEYINWKPYDYKCMNQLEKFFKRIILPTDDSYDLVSEKSLHDFIAAQNEFGIRRRTVRLEIVLRRARRIISEILGSFDFEKLFDNCSFGKKSATDLPFANSYLDVRVDSTLNGTTEQLEWFKVALCRDIHLHRACRRGLKKYKTTYTLNVKPVPKAFDKARIIAPDSTVGGFLSTGVGLYIRKQLESRTHIRLSTQQNRHKELALRYSIDGYGATLDMKRASDSFIKEHINVLIPEDWLPALEVCRSPLGQIKNLRGEIETFEFRSCLLMGSGITFPLQTLLFYALAKATMEELGSNAIVDVYGDDIILPSAFASYVIDIFDDFGLTVNEEKSFVDGPFRESCGGDYHTGIDVRPFMPELQCTSLGKYEYTELLHKLANGFLERWDYVEIPNTYDLILLEIVRVQGNLCPVPEQLPTTSGLKFIPDKFEAVVRKPVYKDGIWTYLVLGKKFAKRSPTTERIYYWYWLHRPWLPPIMPWDDEDVVSQLDKHGKEPQKGVYKYRWADT